MYGDRRATILGEGTLEQWKEIGIVPLDNTWENKTEYLSEIIVGGYNLQYNKILRIISGVCIYKSEGQFDKLPLSFLLELLNLYIFSSRFKVKGTVLLPIAEECHNYPHLSDEFKRLSTEIATFVFELSTFLNIEIEIVTSKKIRYGELSNDSLYGLFTPFSKDSIKKSYPLGNIYEERILKGYESYSLRYKYIGDSKIEEESLIIDGLHLSKSVITGMSKKSQYLVTTPFPSLEPKECCLLVDSKTNLPINSLDYKNLTELNYFDKILRNELGRDLVSIIKLTKKFISNLDF